jgi:DNA polymerase III delta subunit
VDVLAVKNHIKTRSPNNLYLFTGEEIAVQNIYINKIAECKGLEKVRVDSITDIYGKLKNKSFIQKSYCYIIRDDREFMTNEKLWGEIKNVIGDNILIFLITTVDKRSKFYKQYKDTIVEFNLLEPQILKKYIRKEINLSDVNCDKLINICESSYSRILLEINKIDTYISANNTVTPDSAFIKLLNDGTIFQSPLDAIFDYVEALLKHQTKRAFDLLEQCYAVGESTIVLLSVLYNNVKQVLQVQSCESKDIVNSTGLTAWQVKCAKEKTGYYSTGDLVYMLRLIRDTEMKIKTGEIEEQMAMYYIMVNVL